MLDKSILIDDPEIERYAEAVRGFVDGRIDAERFQSIRLQQGIYGQRQDGVNMVRIKIPGGRLNARQAETIAAVLERYSSHPTAHITTRQSIQIHYVPLADTPAVLRRLAGAGLTTREACNNTIRNMTACPLAGVCPSEHADIQPALEQAAAHFLRHPLTQHLPRKFKVSFSGCEQDCAQGLIHDLGIVAVRRGAEFGFKLLAGGGLGHKPREAIVIEEFVPESELLASLEAVVTVHQRYSNRRLRAKSRIKFLVDRFGAEGFIARYREERRRTLNALAGSEPTGLQWREQTATDTAIAAGAPRVPLRQRQGGLNIVPLHVPEGNITVSQLRALSDVMQTNGWDDLRTTQDQSLVLCGVTDEQLESLDARLGSIGLSLPRRGDNIVACPGTSTCRLGITASQSLAARLSGGDDDLSLHVSGCHNGCAQPETADIGIYGEGRRIHGRLIPHYRVYIGGDGRGGHGIGFKSRSIPALRIEQAIDTIRQAYSDGRRSGETFFHWSRRQTRHYFDELLTAPATISAADVDTLVHEHDDPNEFQVVQFGGGECAGAAQETIAALFAEAANERNYRDTFFRQRNYRDSLDCAEQGLRLVGQALLFAAAEEPLEDLAAIASRLEATLDDGAAMAGGLQDFIFSLQRLGRTMDAPSYTTLMSAIDDWSSRAADICEDLDRQLDLSASVADASTTVATAVDAGVSTVDLSSFGCPLHYIKARNTLRQYHDGDVIDFVFASGDAARQAASSLESDGHNVMAVEENGVTTQIRVRKSA